MRPKIFISILLGQQVYNSLKLSGKYILAFYHSYICI